MTARTRLRAALVAGALLSVPVTVASPSAAHAVAVQSPATGETQLLLDSAETAADAVSLSSSSSTCSHAIDQAVGAGIYFSDWARQVCQQAVHTCAQEARTAGRPLSGVVFYRYSGGQSADCLQR